MRLGSLPSPARRILLLDLAAQEAPIWLRTLADKHGIPMGTAYNAMRWPLRNGWVTAIPEDGVGKSKATRLLYSITEAGLRHLASEPSPTVSRETSEGE